MTRHAHDERQARSTVLASGVVATSIRRRLPLVDLVAHARALDAAAHPRRTDIVTAATIWVAAVVATIGFVVASVVDEVLRVEQGRRA